jgi:hypothetical protein
MAIGSAWSLQKEDSNHKKGAKQMKTKSKVRAGLIALL